MYKNYVIVIYDNKTTLPANTCDTIEQAAAWIGCSVSALYKSLHLDGIMRSKGFTVERVKL